MRKVSANLSGFALGLIILVTAIGFTHVDTAKAQVLFNGVEYKSVSEALTATRGTMDPGWLTPERSEAIGNLLADMAAQIVGDLGNLAIASMVPGGAIGSELTGVILNDRIEWLTRSAIEYVRTRPDTRPIIEQLMEVAEVKYSDLSPAPFLSRGTEGYFEYEIAFLNHVQQQLTLRNNAEGRSNDLNTWISFEVFKLESALRDLRTLKQIEIPSSPPENSDSCSATENELFEHFIDAFEGATMAANNEVMRVANAPTTKHFLTDDPDNPHGYTVWDRELCEELTSGSQFASSDFASDVDAKIKEAVSYACMGDGGEMSPQSVRIRDLNGDGADDLILDHQGISCSGGMNISCGAQVCTSEIFLYRGNALEEIIEILNIIGEISSDPVPSIEVFGHGGTHGYIRWNGQSFLRYATN